MKQLSILTSNVCILCRFVQRRDQQDGLELYSASTEHIHNQNRRCILATNAENNCSTLDIYL